MMLKLTVKYIKTVIPYIQTAKLSHGRQIKDLNQNSKHENYNEKDGKHTGSYYQHIGTEEEIISKFEDTAIKTIQSETHTQTHTHRA